MLSASPSEAGLTGANAANWAQVQHNDALDIGGSKGGNALLVHGWLHSAELWSPIFDSLTGSYSLIAPDLPGFGGSTPLPARHINIESFTKIVDYLCVKLRGDTGFHAIVADSLGAVLILNLLAGAGVPSKRLLLSGVPADGIPLLRGGRWTSELIGTGLSMLQVLPRPLARLVVDGVAFPTVQNRTTIDSAFRDAVLTADPRTATCLVRELAHLYVQVNAVEGVRAVCVRGERDKIASHSAMARLANALGAPLVEIPRVGHTPQMEAPREFVKLVRDLVDR